MMYREIGRCQKGEDSLLGVICVDVFSGRVLDRVALIESRHVCVISDTAYLFKNLKMIEIAPCGLRRQSWYIVAK